MPSRILVIEDEPGIVDFLERGLRSYGFEVESAPDGVAGTERAVEEAFDLVVLDLMLPLRGGMEVLQEVREAKPTLPKGAKAPLKSGGAPKGYEVKGNADSGLYHEPDGQWYDQTEAEFYFKTADDAEAAGFTRAGGDKEDDQ